MASGCWASFAEHCLWPRRPSHRRSRPLSLVLSRRRRAPACHQTALLPTLSYGRRGRRRVAPSGRRVLLLSSRSPHWNRPCLCGPPACCLLWVVDSRPCPLKLSLLTLWKQQAPPPPPRPPPAPYQRREEEWKTEGQQRQRTEPSREWTGRSRSQTGQL